MGFRKSSLVIALSTAWLLVPALAVAQPQTPVPGTPGSGNAVPSTSAPAHASQVPDQKITQTATAMQKVMNLRENYEQRLASAAPSQRGAIAQQGDVAIQKAVTDQGLTLAEYNSIIQLAENNPDLRQKLLSRMPRSSGTSPSPGAQQTAPNSQNSVDTNQ